MKKSQNAWFRTMYTYENKTSEMEENSGKVLTEPDQALSIREIVERYSRGIPLTDLVREGEYYEEENDNFAGEDFNQIKTMDMVEIDEKRRENKAFQEQIKEKAEKAEKAELEEIKTESSAAAGNSTGAESVAESSGKSKTAESGTAQSAISSSSDK